MKMHDAFYDVRSFQRSGGSSAGRETLQETGTSSAATERSSVLFCVLSYLLLAPLERDGV